MKMDDDNRFQQMEAQKSRLKEKIKLVFKSSACVSSGMSI